MSRVQIEIAKANLEPLLEHMESSADTSHVDAIEAEPAKSAGRNHLTIELVEPTQKRNGRRHRRRPLLFPN
jgi:hypothetical protein